MRRLLLILLIVPVAALALYGARWSLAGLYVRIAQMQSTPDDAALAANRLATELAPWRPAFHAAYSRSLIVNGHTPEQVLAPFHTALNWAPADANLWLDYSQIMAYQGQFGPNLELAATRVNALSPMTPQIQFSQALLGVYYWYQAPMPVQQQWTRSQSWALAHQPKKFLNTIVAGKQMYWFCASAALELPLQKWCGYLWDAYAQGAIPTEGPPP